MAFIHSTAFLFCKAFARHDVMSGDGFSLGDVFGKISIDFSGVEKAIQKTTQSLEKFFTNSSSTFADIGKGFTGLASTLSSIAVPLGTLGGVGLKAAADFDTLMNQIGVFGNVSGDSLERVRQLALKMGADTNFSASDAAEAYLELLKAGLSVELAMSTLPDVMNLAATGSMSLAEASSVVTSALAQFHLDAKASEKVTNALARAANASKADVTTLGQALQGVGPVAAQFGLSIDDTSAVLAVFANNGIEGSEAGTQLKSMLLNLSRPTEDVKAAFKKLGVSMYDTEGNVRDFNTIILDLDKALASLPVQEQNELMQTLAGSYGIVGLSALRASGGIDDMRDAMQKAPDAAQVAAEMMKTFAGNVEGLKGSFETLMITALTPFMNNVLQPLVKELTTVINKINDWSIANPELTQQIVTVLSSVVAAVPVLFALGKAFEFVGGIVKTLGVLIGFITSPIGLAIALIGTLVYAYTTNLGGLRDFIDNEVAPRIREFNDNVIQPTIRRLQEIWTQVRPMLEALANWFMAEGWVNITSTIDNFRVNILNPVIQRLKDLWTETQPMLTALMNWFVTVGIPAITTAISNFKLYVLDPLLGGLKALWDDVAPKFALFLDWFLTTGLPEIKRLIEDFDLNVWKPLVAAIAGIWEAVQEPLGTLLSWFLDPKKGLQQIVSNLNDFVEKTWGALVTAITSLWGNVKKGLQDFADGIKNTLKPVTDFIQGIIDKINEVIASVENLLGVGGKQGGSGGGYSGGSSGGGIGGGTIPLLLDPKALGGPVTAGQPYLVGEIGPELFVPRSSGTIIPNNALGGSTVYNVTITPAINPAAGDVYEQADVFSAAFMARLHALK